MIFVHGGYWLRFGRRDFSHLAQGACSRDWAVALPSYPLAPGASIPQITQSGVSGRSIRLPAASRDRLFWRVTLPGGTWWRAWDKADSGLSCETSHADPDHCADIAGRRFAAVDADRNERTTGFDRGILPRRKVQPCTGLLKGCARMFGLARMSGRRF
jgi:hypothetical protein